MIARIFFILLLSVLVIGKSQSWTSLAEFTESGEIFTCEKNLEELPGEEESVLSVPIFPVLILISQSYSFRNIPSFAYQIISIKFPDRRGSPQLT
ncbi:hypothetical protein ND861_13460 [Leptospira sp. 2 VSF19]|uniref:Uncharacterized protein n=1 Tax=Leptospira soteropolitanensis TaxID=2950025 RepID=A0AAW5VQ34_9LEPT|nr:hypothetical protein [Leptospira soteropolitanensis]MCW7493652.1 hypothetical protein [Leptospira soteropolitanensis]MCW7501250.1 hypothetical protein [Leptospira soteropolitanensis]MCW7523564.1 hypothetical protein [Leptospira soteropolitanensis]MCW7527364.1 hypothetical protein [Leptospira soteropolitanensis]MCW7531220.1 hypothetical protein [Leptospira soteropolitanensis]